MSNPSPADQVEAAQVPVVWYSVDQAVPADGYMLVGPTTMDGVPEVWAAETYHLAKSKMTPAPGWDHLVEAAALIRFWAHIPPFPTNEAALRPVTSVAPEGMGYFGASEFAAYEYPGEDQQALRDAFCRGAALAALPPASGSDHGPVGWRPIADAPRDGTPILIRRATAYPSEEGQHVVRWEDNWWQVHDGKNDHPLRGPDPTEWQPPPPPPAGDK